MRFPVDVSSDARLARHLQRRGFDAARVGWDDPQDLTDEAIRAIALAEARVILTDDRDVEKLAVRFGLPYAGIISVRLESSISRRGLPAWKPCSPSTAAT